MEKSNWRTALISSSRYEIHEGAEVLAVVFNKSNAELMASAPDLLSEVERLRSGIDKVLYAIANEDISDPYFLDDIQSDLIRIYQGETPKYANPFYKEESK